MSSVAPQPWPRRDRAIGAALFALAALLRAAYVIAVRDHPAVRLPMLDSLSYHTKALGILAGTWPGNAVFYQDPLYSYFLALLYAVFGPRPLAVGLAQALLDAATTWGVFALGRALFGVRAGALAGLMAATSTVSIFYSALLLKASLSCFLIVFALLGLVTAARRDRIALWLAAGAALGLASLTRGNYLLFVPVALAWIAATTPGSLAARGRRAALVAAGLALAIAPATAHNRLAGGDWVLITSQAGQNFYIGNHLGNATGGYVPPPFVTANPFFEERDFAAEAERRTGGAGLSPSQRSSFWMRESLREIATDPGHFARHTFTKLRLLLSESDIPSTQSFAFFRARVAPALGLPAPNWGVVLPLALLGIVWSRREPKAQLVALYLATYAATILLTFNMGRYRAPMAPVLMVFAGAALVRALDLWRRQNRATLLAAAAFLIPAYAVVYADAGRESLAATHYNLGARLLLDGSEAAAEAQFREGLSEEPDHPGLRKALATLLMARAERLEAAGRFEEAETAARETLEWAPRNAAAWVVHGRALAGSARYEEARRALRRALTLDPDHSEARRELAFVDELERSAALGDSR